RGPGPAAALQDDLGVELLPGRDPLVDRDPDLDPRRLTGPERADGQRVIGPHASALDPDATGLSRAGVGAAQDQPDDLPWRGLGPGEEVGGFGGDDLHVGPRWWWMLGRCRCRCRRRLAVVPGCGGQAVVARSLPAIAAPA